MNSLSVQSYFGADKEVKSPGLVIPDKPKRKTFQHDNM